MALSSKPRFAMLLVRLLLRVSGVFAQTGFIYQLDSEYSGANFFQGWDFYTGGDPTGGYVTYYSQGAAQLTGLINASATAPTYIGADYQTVTNLNGAGRPSVRISTQKSWTHGLFIGDFAHAPGGVCGTWPAFWTLAPNWPYNGEIDILEGVNQLTENTMSLHSNVNCSIAGDPTTETGTVGGHDCTYYVEYGGNGVGCGVVDNRTTSYGTGFNDIGGGVYAMQWTSDYIRVWFFPRNAIPPDITNLTPNPSVWGLPAANLAGSCDIDDRFQGHSIIFDDTFCGSYAGVPSVWDSPTASCQTLTGYATCNEFVAAEPGAFQDAYWSINSVRVYQLLTNDSNPITTPYIASLQPASSVTASSTSTTPAATPTTSLCPTYDYAVVKEGVFHYEIECGTNPPGQDIGPPYSGYPVSRFEDCVGGCSYWNTYNGSNLCAGVTYNFNNNACYWKSSITGTPADPDYNGARLIYYAYPQANDNPSLSASATSANSAYISTTVEAQHYSNPTVTSTSQFLSTASVVSSLMGFGAGYSINLTSSDITTSSYTPSSSSSAAVSSPSSTSLSSASSSPSINATPSSVATSATAVDSTLVSSSPPTVVEVSTSIGITTTSSAASSLVPSSSKSSTGSSISPWTISLLSSAATFYSTSLSLGTTSSLQSLSTSSTLPFASSMGPPATGSTTLSSLPSTSGFSSPNPMSTTSPASSSSFTVPSTPLPTTLSFGSSTMGVSTATIPTSTQGFTGSNPSAVGRFVYGGCYGAADGLFTDFSAVETDLAMRLEICISDCWNSSFAGVYFSTCYCAKDPSAGDQFIAYPDFDCNIPCPGTPLESCGGQAIEAFSPGRRQAAGTLLTVYNNTLYVSGSAAEESSSSSDATVGPSSISTQISLSANVSPTAPTSSSTTFTNDAESGMLTNTPISSILMTLAPTAITTIFVDVCDICEDGMTTATTIVTVMHCGCTESVNEAGSTIPVPPPAIPMTETVKACSCGVDKATSSTRVIIPCTSAIEEMSSSMASMIAAPEAAAGSNTSEATPAAAGQESPAEVGPVSSPGSASTGESDSNAPGLSNTAAASEARSADVAAMTNGVGPETGMSGASIGNATGFATTKTYTLQSTETTAMLVSQNGSVVASARLGPSPIGTGQSTGGPHKSDAAERILTFAAAAALFGALVLMALL